MEKHFFRKFNFKIDAINFYDRILILIIDN